MAEPEAGASMAAPSHLLVAASAQPSMKVNSLGARPRLEICCFGFAAAQQAFSTTVPDRIELCATDSQDVGGSTPIEVCTIPRLDLLRKLNRVCPVRVMVRPNPWTDEWSQQDCTDVLNSICEFSALSEQGQSKHSGVVFGLLGKSAEKRGMINTELCKKAVMYAHAIGMRCTFHRAFDAVEDKVAGLEKLIDCGFDAVLTAGGTGGAIANIETLTNLVKQAQGRIEIIVGGGVRSSNLLALLETGAKVFHSSAITNGGDMPDLKELERLRVTIREWYDAKVSDLEQISWSSG